ncbi:hypothetical protein TREMEDRAFT_31271 [Tremella mesenterica DSM 1558]|uniref:uncharacterized protein n=1 Tax=Tremella mesenterica (strain ATCC 24925 / CBS 8224 / DSM 1558 / NBRC 9311 / NRRL Y-6157 / RJB 2259-6 / UBC 559-6) TaxID=578456 RepID=UPI0003F493C9|nr:uncharacterized protein TREMEDRAFT_31271 [Tremella mesenterica DSM 1558]EIW68931.1 hypothetical protein TREMEDRAFT_31271 [Tremella mesenterica DSM 1558]
MVLDHCPTFVCSRHVGHRLPPFPPRTPSSLFIDASLIFSGISGYLITEIAVQLLNDGWTVRGAVRNENKAKTWEKLYFQFKETLEWSYVPDIVIEGAFDDAVKSADHQGVDYVIYTAFPLGVRCNDPEADMLLPAIRGTLNVLKAAHKVEGIRRIVVTSSFGAMEDYGQPWNPDLVYDESCWCPITYERACQEKIDDALIYCCSKKEAEQAAWKYMETEKPPYELSVAIPTTVFGPTKQPVKTPADLPLSCQRVAEFFDAKSIPTAPVAPPCVDIGDMATCHVRAMLLPHAAGQRYLCGVNGFTQEMIASVLKKAFPDQAHRIPPFKEKAVDDVFKWDGSK